MIRKLLAVALLVFAGAALVACNGAAVLNTITPSSAFEREPGVAYGALPRQKLDVYRSEADTPREAVVMFVYGGSWTDGSRDMYKFVGDAFAMEGFDVVVPDYRLYPEARYGTLMADMRGAVEWTGEAFPDRPIVLVGHSAGGYNVLQAVFDEDALGDDACIAGVVGLAAPTGAYELTDEPYVTIFPDRFRGGDDAPLELAKGGQTDVPPLLLVHGADDTVVGPRNSTELADAVGERATVRLYEGRDHVDVVRLLSRHFDGDDTLKADVVEWIEGLPGGCAG